MIDTKQLRDEAVGLVTNAKQRLSALEPAQQALATVIIDMVCGRMLVEIADLADAQAMPQSEPTADLAQRLNQMTEETQRQLSDISANNHAMRMAAADGFNRRDFAKFDALIGSLTDAAIERAIGQPSTGGSEGGTSGA